RHTRFSRDWSSDVCSSDLDTETLRVVTPGGSIGTVDVEVSLNSGQVGVLKNAFRYLQPVQASIQGEGRIYDAELDPTGTYLMTEIGRASGRERVENSVEEG